MQSKNETRKNRIVVIGRGQIGRAIVEAFTEYEAIQWQGDISDLGIAELENLRPWAVINAAGKTDLAWCEANPLEAIRSNLEAPVQLAERISRLDSKTGPRFIQFSSACIWDGPYDSDGKPFTPDSPPTPACLYSWTKAAADALLVQSFSKFTAIIRARQVYSAVPSARNTITKLIHYPKLVDTPNSISSLGIIRKTLRYLLTAESEWRGIWNVYDRGVTTPYEIGTMLHNAGMREKPERISKSELDTFHKPKRVDTVIYDERFERLIEPVDVRKVLVMSIEALKHVLAEGAVV